MSKKLSKEENKLYRKYHYPHCGNLSSVKVGAIFLSKANTVEHERKKFEICWDLLEQGNKFITEAERKATDEERDVFKLRLKKIVDVVDITNETEFEIIHKHETDEQIDFYRKKGTIVVLVGETIQCKKCMLKYPKRNKKGICQICLKVGK
jgi:hypothetical protein